MKPSDDLITSMTTAEMMWMNAMLAQDEKEDYDEKLTFVEYLASFSNPEAVRKIRSDRKNAKVTSDDDFAQLLTSITGREAPQFTQRG